MNVYPTSISRPTAIPSRRICSGGGGSGSGVDVEELKSYVDSAVDSVRGELHESIKTVEGYVDKQLGDYLTESKADGTYAKLSALSSYLTKTDASSTYATKQELADLDLTGYVEKTDLEGFATEADLLAFYYPDGNVTSMDQITTSGIEYAVGDDGGAYVVRGEELTGDVVLPWKVTINGKEYKVTAIGESVFYNEDLDLYNTFKTFTASIFVKELREYAFHYCDSLTSVSFPSVTRIGESAFASCGSLASASFPSAASIGDNAFNSCYALRSASFPSATSVGASAFGACGSLTSVNLPSATSIGEYTFAECGSSLTSISLPSVTSVGGYAFEGCYSLTSVDLPSATSVGEYAFGGCGEIISISLPSVTSVGAFAFEACLELSSMFLSSATSIGDGAFGGCDSLSSISLPSVTSIGGMAFDGCRALKTIDFGSAPKSSVPSLSEDAFNGIPGTCKFIIPLGMYNEWISAPYWRNLHADGYKFEGYVSAGQVKDKRDKTDNIATKNEVGGWRFISDNPIIHKELNTKAGLTHHQEEDGTSLGWELNYDGYGDLGFEFNSGLAEGGAEATSLDFGVKYWDANGNPVTVKAVRDVITKSGEPYVTPTGVEALVPKTELQVLVPETTDTTVTLKPVDGAANWVDGKVEAQSKITGRTFSTKYEIWCDFLWISDDDEPEEDRLNGVLTCPINEGNSVIEEFYSEGYGYWMCNIITTRDIPAEIDMGYPEFFKGAMIPKGTVLSYSFYYEGDEEGCTDPSQCSFSIGSMMPNTYDAITSIPGTLEVDGRQYNLDLCSPNEDLSFTHQVVFGDITAAVTIPASTDPAKARKFTLAVDTDVETETAVEWQGGEVTEAFPGASKLVPGEVVWDVKEVAPGKMLVNRTPGAAGGAVTITGDDGTVYTLAVDSEGTLEVRT